MVLCADYQMKKPPYEACHMARPPHATRGSLVLGADRAPGQGRVGEGGGYFNST